MKGFEVDFMHDSLDRVMSVGIVFSITDVMHHMSAIKPDLGLSYMAIRSILLKEINDRISKGELISPVKGKYLLLVASDESSIKVARSLKAVSLGFLEGNIDLAEYRHRVTHLSRLLSNK